MTENFYITTPIYYVNGEPHIGHAYTTILCDAIARFKRLDGANVKFLTGTDEHGQKVEKAAIIANKTPQEYVDNLSLIFKDLVRILNISNDDFIRTTEPRHKKCAIAIWNKLYEAGHIYKNVYSGWYSLRDEAFYAESELTPDGNAPTGSKVEWVEEESYFFNLSKWGDKLLEFYENNPDFIFPKSRKNEVIGFVKGGLHDLSISRATLKWGIEIPNDPGHVMYVWLDALTNYLSALRFPDVNSPDYQNFWPCNIHMIGKDILRFHAIYWPAFLMAAELPLPKQIIAHGWWVKEGQKISKSEGNIIIPKEIIDEFGVDQFRYFLLREVNLGNDGDYSREALINRVNSELSNKIGNLLQRTLAMIYKNCDQKIPIIDDNIYDNYSILVKAEKIYNKVSVAMNIPDIVQAIGYIVELAEDANCFIDEQAPWALKNTNFSKMEEVLYVVVEICRYIGILMQPFIPASASKMLDLINVKESQRYFENLNRNYRILGGEDIAKPEGIFPRF